MYTKMQHKGEGDTNILNDVTVGNIVSLSLTVIQSANHRRIEIFNDYGCRLETEETVYSNGPF